MKNLIATMKAVRVPMNADLIKATEQARQLSRAMCGITHALDNGAAGVNVDQLVGRITQLLNQLL